jgi:hypothetical protein
MTRRHTSKNRKSLRRNKRSAKRRDKRSLKNKLNGGGWTEGMNWIDKAPGNLIHNPYPGPGKDCTGNPHSIRPGYIFDYDPKGLPGFKGGAKRRNKNRKSLRRKTSGGTQLNVADSSLPGPVPNPNLPPVSSSVTPKPGDFPNTTGTAGTVANPQGLPVVMSMPGVPPPGMAQMPKVQLDSSASASNLAAPQPQKGGRYGFFPGMGPLNPANGVGTTPGPFGRIPCEVGTYNPLNPDPNGIQTMSTAPLTPPFVTGKLAGGGLPAGTGLAASSANFPTVQVGQADSMRYYAPTAGYRNDFMTFSAPSPVPGLTIQTPYDAKAFNEACIKTGGSRKNKKNKNKGGALPVALDAGKFTPVTLGEIWTRYDFDGTNKLLPVKFGGARRKTRRGLKKRRSTHKKSRN